ncbi:hypothetical protein CCP3SC15_4330003 [Gammaproteobacteria bacterium]
MDGSWLTCRRVCGQGGSTFAERLAETDAQHEIIQKILGHDGGGVTSRCTGPVVRQMLSALEQVTRENVTVPRAVMVVTQNATQERRKAG